MSNETANLTPQPEKSTREKLPAWALPIVSACRAVAPFLLVVGGILLIAVLATAAIVGDKKVNLSWCLHLVGLLTFLLTLGFLALLIAQVRKVLPGWALFVLGFALYYAQLLFAMLAKEFEIGEKTDAFNVVRVLSEKLHSLGVFTIIIAAVSLLVSYLLLFQEREEMRRSVRFQYIDPTDHRTEKPSPVPKCWQMSRCRPSVRTTCPNYIDKKTCWKRRSGCFCDRELANFLIGSVGKGEAQEVIDMQKRAGVHQAVSMMRGHMTEKSKRPSWKVQKYRCHNCPLFVEHQEYKYRTFSWTSILITGALAAAAWTFFDAAYKIGAVHLTQMLEQYRVVTLGASAPELANSPFEYILYAVLFLLLWSYVINFMDTFFLEWKM